MTSKKEAAKRIIVIGGVAAGTSAAAKARRMTEEAEIVIYEKYKYISFATCGLPYYVSGSISSLGDLIINDAAGFEKRFNIDVKILHEVLSIDTAAKRMKVKDLTTGAVFEDSYDSLIIATGSLPVIFNKELCEAGNAFILKTIDDAARLKAYMANLTSPQSRPDMANLISPQSHPDNANLTAPQNASGENASKNGAALKAKKDLSAVIIGGGYIGLELIEAFLAGGFKITIVEKTGQILPLFDFEIIEYLENYLAGKGITLLKNEEITGFERLNNNNDNDGCDDSNNNGGNGDNGGGNGDNSGADKAGIITAVRTASGKIIASDIIFISTGTKPEVSLAAACGLKIGPSGAIAVNETMQTSALGVYAAGDCAECTDFITGAKQPQNLAFTANMQGRCAGCNAAGGDSTFLESNPTSIIKVLDVEIAKTGISFKEAKKLGINALKIEMHSLNHAGYYPGASLIHMIIIYNGDSGVVIGFEAIGKESVDKKLDTMAVAIKCKMKISELAYLNLGYHPAYGSAKDSLNIAGMIGENIGKGEFESIDIEELKKKITAGEQMTILDVRTKGEYNSGHIENAINIPVDTLRDNIETLDKNSHIIVHCRTSYRSYLAYRILKNAGFVNVKNLNGSYLSILKKL
jgi:NADPH-dependent 2,4-dienoyl-CoA reductase/sulfur reductase-like enzyme/rhodanese-related sulfurtransferase